MIHISDELFSQLQRQSERLGCTQESLAEDAIEARLHVYAEPSEKLTTDQMARMEQSLAQLARGEVVSSEAVDEKFERFFRTLANRREAA